MIRKTLKNMERATKIIHDKGYEWDKANDIAIDCFQKCRLSKNGMPVEWFIDKICKNY